jgi:hypothetical protein
MKKAISILLFLLTLSPLDLRAATAVCTSKVLKVGIHVQDSLFVILEGLNGFQFCNLESVSYQMSALSCRHIHATLLLAQALGKTVTVYIDNAPSPDCNQIPQWHISQTRYVQLND